MMVSDLKSFQRREADLDQPVSFIIFSINNMKSLGMYFINKQTEGLVVINAFSVGIYVTKMVKVVRLSQCYNAIFGGVHLKVFVYVGAMTKVELHDHLEVVRYDEKKLYCTYEVNIAVFSIQRV